MMKKTLIFFALIGLTACSSFKNQSLKEAAAEAEVDYKLTETEQKIIRKNNDFGLRLFKLSTDRSHFSNVALSPMGVIYSLNMLNNGATAQTQREIYQALSYDKADREQLNPFYRRLLITQRKEQGPQAGDLPTYMQTSNLLAFMNDIAIEKDFQDTLSTYYFAQMETAKSTEELQKAADEWCVRQSGGRVTHVPLKMDEQTKACLVNLIRSEEHTSELQSRQYLVCRLLLEKKNRIICPRWPARPAVSSAPWASSAASPSGHSSSFIGTHQWGRTH